MSIKWTSFTTGGELSVGNKVVGLSSSNLNRRFDFPGTGIKDATGVYLLRWLPAITTASNYLTFVNAVAGVSPSIAGSGSDSDVGIQLVSKGSGIIKLTTSSTGYTIFDSTAAAVLPIGTTAERPTGFGGMIRYNSTLGAVEAWDGNTAQWAAYIRSITGTTDRIDVSGAATATINISPNYIGQNTINTVGIISTGSWRSSTEPVGVSYGGTGVVGITAYAVVCGGTTGTQPVQPLVSNGTLGQILTSNGASALPSWQSGNILGRTTAATTGFVGESLTGTYATQTFPIAASYANFSTSIVTPSLSAGVWLILVNGGIAINAGGVLYLRIIDSNANVLLSPGEVLVNFGANPLDGSMAMSVVATFTSTVTVTVQYRAVSATGLTRDSSTIQAIRIA